MDEKDFAAIMKKYHSLMSDPAASEKKQVSDPAHSSENSSEKLQEELNEIFSSSSGEDRFLEDRFLRAPVAAPSQTEQGDEGYEHVMFNSLFASVDQGDAFNQDKVANREKYFKENGMVFDLLASDFARRLYQYELDLRQNYDPTLGVYPTQALYTPKTTKSNWVQKTSPKPEKEKEGPSSSA